MAWGRSEMQTASTTIWTRVSECIFYADNRYVKSQFV